MKSSNPKKKYEANMKIVNAKNVQVFVCLFGLFHQFSNKNKRKKKRITRRR